MSEKFFIDQAIETFERLKLEERQRVIDASTRAATTATERDMLERTGLVQAFEVLIADGWEHAQDIEKKFDHGRERYLFGPRFLNVNMDAAIKRRIEIMFNGLGLKIDFTGETRLSSYNGGDFFGLRMNWEFQSQRIQFHFSSPSGLIVSDNEKRYADIAIHVHDDLAFRCGAFFHEENQFKSNLFALSPPYLSISDFEYIDKSKPGAWMSHFLEFAAAFKE